LWGGKDGGNVGFWERTLGIVAQVVELVTKYIVGGITEVVAVEDVHDEEGDGGETSNDSGDGGNDEELPLFWFLGWNNLVVRNSHNSTIVKNDQNDKTKCWDGEINSNNRNTEEEQ